MRPWELPPIMTHIFQSLLQYLYSYFLYPNVISYYLRLPVADFHLNCEETATTGPYSLYGSDENLATMASQMGKFGKTLFHHRETMFYHGKTMFHHGKT